MQCREFARPRATTRRPVSRTLHTHVLASSWVRRRGANRRSGGVFAALSTFAQTTSTSETHSTTNSTARTATLRLSVFSLPLLHHHLTFLSITLSHPTPHHIRLFTPQLLPAFISFPISLGSYVPFTFLSFRLHQRPLGQIPTVYRLRSFRAETPADTVKWDRRIDVQHPCYE